ncbi:pyridine nucleotide-disulfide oxidoreductase [Streptomyces sp. LHD-70]|uniref:pyridine nucleotide-disulfide oxidoreductase n=1 Tax=Streptomyces sp. LHD-70 TaxID=3072140 RepID=UPI00280CAE8F|nr:pyridine nucleotide-disulfide oxidoreductase [Streptomyces sp. LHD-70]MDQ8703787.1 pyridine nucleotide-disulfide oxidoreductase [Streptomyces sp. LHD-70]
MSTVPRPRPRRAVVIGGGLTGTLAAAALAEQVDEVTVVERDALPQRPSPRRSLAQARHAHILWSGGARAIESLLPGVLDDWTAAGAHRIPLPSALVSMTPQGWFRRGGTEMQFLISCSRDLLDFWVRRRVLALPEVRLLEQTVVTGLLGSAGRVRGVRAHSPGGGVQELPADLVVDASGRGTRAVQWLSGLGIGPVREAEVDAGVLYASRLYQAPPGVADFPLVNVQPRANTGEPGRGSIIVPVEGGRWLVTLCGTRGAHPPQAAAEFEGFAREVRDPVVGELIARARPLDDEVTLSRSTYNRRRYLEKCRTWPEGFVVLGDAVATYNPVYGHGMSVAAQGVLALRAELRRNGPQATGLARRVQRAVATPIDMAWQMAAGQDVLYPEATGPRPTFLERAGQRYIDRLTSTATSRPYAARSLLEVMTLSAPATGLFRPRLVLAALRGPSQPALTAPPLTDEERAMVYGNGDRPEAPHAGGTRA